MDNALSIPTGPVPLTMEETEIAAGGLAPIVVTAACFLGAAAAGALLGLAVAYIVFSD